MRAPLPENETDRLNALRSYKIVGTPPEAVFDDLTQLAAQICEVPIALVTFIDKDQQWLKSTVGISGTSTPRDEAFCAHTILHADRILEVRDARSDPRFADNDSVTGGPGIRFYAGAPLVNRAGYALGSLCVIDREPRTLRPEQVNALLTLSRHVVAQLELRRQSDGLLREMELRTRAEEQLRQQNDRLEKSRREMSELLALAEDSRKALLNVLEDEQQTTTQLSFSNRALRMLTRCTEAMILAQDEISLLNQVCQIAVELGDHDLAWVGYAEDDQAKDLTRMAQWGDAAGSVPEAALTSATRNALGLWPARRCLIEGEPVYSKKGDGPGVICLPLRDGGLTFGVLCLHTAEAREIGEAEGKLLEELGDYLAFGINALRSRVVRDYTEEALVTSVREKDALLREVHHRVKNNLQVITSLLRLEGRRIDHPTTKSVLTEMQGRIQSMALLHETLYRSGNFAQVDLAAYLSDLLHQLFRSQLSRPGLVKLNLDLASVHVAIDQAIPCGLIVNELASNCLKHGFPDGRTGEVWVRLRADDDGVLCLTVRDNGAGLSSDFAAKRERSLGLQLVGDLARQIQGGVTIGPGPEASFEVTFKPTHTVTSETPRPQAPQNPEGAAKGA